MTALNDNNQYVNATLFPCSDIAVVHHSERLTGDDCRCRIKYFVSVTNRSSCKWLEKISISQVEWSGAGMPSIATRKVGPLLRLYYSDNNDDVYHIIHVQNSIYRRWKSQKTILFREEYKIKNINRLIHKNIKLRKR